MGLMTPVIKGVCTDIGLVSTVLAQQIWGGHGYIAENGMEQFVRDARVNEIYEGSNGIQALESRRTEAWHEWRPWRSRPFFSEVDAYLKAQASGPREWRPTSIPYSSPSAIFSSRHSGSRRMQRPTAIMQGAGSYDYMNLFGLVALGYMWCRMVEVARAKLAKTRHRLRPASQRQIGLLPVFFVGNAYCRRTSAQLGAHQVGGRQHDVAASGKPSDVGSSKALMPAQGRT